VLILAFVPVMLVAAGFAVGVLTGFFGVGGGFIVVPVLSIWLGAGFRRAVATSLVIITLTGVAALVSHLSRVRRRMSVSRRLWRARPPWVRWPARRSTSGSRSARSAARSPSW